MRTSCSVIIFEAKAVSRRGRYSAFIEVGISNLDWNAELVLRGGSNAFVFISVDKASISVIGAISSNASSLEINPLRMASRKN